MDKAEQAKHNLESCRFIFKMERLIEEFYDHTCDLSERDANNFCFYNMAKALKSQLASSVEAAKYICDKLGEPDLDHEPEGMTRLKQ
jgi:hypothetical protein